MDPGWTLISINWTAQALTGEQLLVLRNVAAQHLRQRKKVTVLHFSHDLCEGSITRGKEGSFGTFGGTFFTADLGMVKGERWTCDFLLPRGTEDMMIDDDSIVLTARPLKGGDFETTKVNHKKASINEPTAQTLH